MLEVQESILKTIRSGFGAETEPESAQPAQE
jgi:hypothetical protein